MKGKKQLYYFIEALSWICLIGNFIGLGYFVKDIWSDYSSRKTNDRVFSKRINSYNHPYITICFEPQVNISELKKYNKTVAELSHWKFGIPLMNLSVPVHTLIDEIRFKVGRDFTLDFVLSGHQSNLGYVQTNSSEETSSVELEELPMIMYGTCTIIKVSSKIKGAMQMNNAIELKFKSEDRDSLPLINVFFTSDKNIHGAFWQQWMEGEIFALTIDPIQNLDYSVKLKQRIVKKLPETSHCSLDVGYYKCLAKE